MGLIQGGRKLDGLNRWDGTLIALVVSPHLLNDQQKVHFKHSAHFHHDSPLFSSPDYSPQSSIMVEHLIGKKVIKDSFFLADDIFPTDS